MPNIGKLGWAYVSGSTVAYTGQSDQFVTFYSGSGDSKHVSGSNRFKYDYEGDNLFLTGTLHISGAINAYEFKTIVHENTTYLGTTTFGNDDNDLHQFTGKISGSANATIVGNIYTDANLNVSGSSTLRGNVTTQGNLSGSGNATIVGNIYTDANMLVSGAAIVKGDIEAGDVAASLGAPNHNIAGLQTVSGQGNLAVYQTVAPTQAVPQALIYNNAASTTSPMLRIQNANADQYGPILDINKDSSSPADDDEVGRIQFGGKDSGGNQTVFGAMEGFASDVTDGDEGGLLKFSVMAGGTAGTAARVDLLTIGGEDVANSTPCEVVVNEASVDCDFRVESDGNANMFFVNAGTNRVGIGTNAPATTFAVAGSTSVTGSLAVTGSEGITIRGGEGEAATLTLIEDQGDDAGDTCTFTYDANNLTIDVAADINLDADGGEIFFKDGGSQKGVLKMDTSNKFILSSSVSTNDLHLMSGRDVYLDAAGGQVTVQDDGADHFLLDCDNTKFVIYDDQDTGDLFEIQIAQHGATTIKTLDDDAAAANLTFDVDGNVKFDDTPGGVEIQHADNSAAPPGLLIDNNTTGSIGLSVDCTGLTVPAVQIGVAGGGDLPALTGDNGVDGSLLNVQNLGTNADKKRLVGIYNNAGAATGVSLLSVFNVAAASAGDKSTVWFATRAASETNPLLTLKNINADEYGPVLKLQKDSNGLGSGASADDDGIGTIHFVGDNDAGTPEDINFVSMVATSTDVTDGDEGGKLVFNVMAGGTAGTAAAANLLSIGGEDVANATKCEVVVNEAGIDCDFRVESDGNANMLFVDAGNNGVGIGTATATYPLTVVGDISGSARGIFVGDLTTAGQLNVTGAMIQTGDIEQGGVAAALGGAAFHKIANLQSTSGQGSAGFYQTVAPTNAVPQVLVYNSAAVSDGSPQLRVENANADENGAILNIHKSSASPADDDTLGFVTFSGRNASAATKTYAEMKVRSTDVTANDEGGEISFSVFAGGSGGTAALSNLLKIGGEDVANSGPCEVAVNDAGVPCTFRLGSGRHMITVDQDIRFADSGDNSVIVEIPGVKIPAHSIITRVVVIPKVLSNLSTHLVNLQFSATSGTAADSTISSGTELIGAGAGGAAADYDSSDSDDTKEDIAMQASSGDLKEVYMSEALTKVGGSDVYLYVCNAGTGNGTTNSSAGTLTIMVEYFGMD